MVYMEKSTLIRQLNFAPDGMDLVQKVDKIYLGNPCFIYALADDVPEIGNVRETFFYCSMCVNHKVTASPVSDFLVKGHTFEVGGKSKNQKQILFLFGHLVLITDICLVVDN